MFITLLSHLLRLLRKFSRKNKVSAEFLIQKIKKLIIRKMKAISIVQFISDKLISGKMIVKILKIDTFI